MNTSELVRSKRKTLGFTQKEFSDFLGLGDSGERTVRGWENDEHIPTKRYLDEIMALKRDAPFRSRTRKPKFTFIDLFAGIGGIRLPFQELRGECVFSSEWDKFARKTYATAIPASEIPPHDLLLAGFPCQAFSQAGLKKGFHDTRGTMFFEIQRILAYHRPKAFLLENVKQLKGHNKGQTLKTILEILTGQSSVNIPKNVPMSAESRSSLSKKLDYEVDFRVLKASDFGVPQKRERIYIVGFDRKYFSSLKNSKEFKWPEPLQQETRLGDILENNKNVDKKYTISDRLLAGHKRRLKEHRAKGNGFGYSVFNQESPCANTISARYYKDGSEILIDQSDLKKNPRKLIPRECARLQGFPEEFIVNSVSDVQAYRQFGNSVSIPVVRAIAKKINHIINSIS